MSLRLAQLFSQQVWVVRVARQTKVQQHGMAVGVHQHVGGFDVEMAGVLLVQAVGCACDGGPHARHIRHGRLGALMGVRVQHLLQGLSLHVLHD
jgi:hypothetical protein